MSMVCGLDLHRGQITFDALEVDTGEVWRGRIWSPDRARLRRWLADELAPRAHGGPVAVAVEGCTGWRYVVEEVAAAGFEAHVAEPADTQAARGRKKRAKSAWNGCPARAGSSRQQDAWVEATYSSEGADHAQIAPFGRSCLRGV
jgi:hypothetical protein